MNPLRIDSVRRLTLDRPRIMGILNLTPDSFSDGGAYSTTTEGVNAALRMLDAGACIIDVGGESTRPGAEPISAEEQIRRTLPTIEALAKRLDADSQFISIDTTRAPVAERALDAGASIINDVSAGLADRDMFTLAAARGCAIVLMHRLTDPRRDSYSDQYQLKPDYGGNVVGVVRDFLHARCEAAKSAGVHAESIVIDPGLGFGKSVKQNFELAGRIETLQELNYPVLSAASRKSFLGAAAGIEQPLQRVAAGVAVSVAHYLKGARLFRVHDVREHRQALEVAMRISDFGF